MHARQIILLVGFFSAAVACACDTLAQMAYDATGPVMMLPPAEDCSTPQPVFIEPTPADCSTPQPYFVVPQGPMMAPGMPSNVVPLVPMPPGAGPMFGAPPVGAPGTMVYPGAPPAETLPPGGVLEHIAPGGAISPRLGLPAGPEVAAGPNVVQVPVANDEAAWEQIVDVVTDYFPVAAEQQARRSGPVWTEGRIETRYVSGATIFEPFSKNSVGAYNRWESTFQTIRRIAAVRVIPDAVGYQVEVIVEKELEDLPRPEQATAGTATFNTTGSLPSQRMMEVSRLRSSPRWIRMGRDPALEARMAADIQSRFTGQPDSSWTRFWW